MKIIGYKGTRDGIAVLEVDPEDIIGPDEEHDECEKAFRASKVKVIKGGGVSLADSRVRYVKGRYVYPLGRNGKSRWNTPFAYGIYFTTLPELAEFYHIMWGNKRHTRT